MTELDDRVLRSCWSRRPTRARTPTLEIRYLTAPAGAVQHLRGRAAGAQPARRWCTQSRPLRATDAMLTTIAAAPEQDADVFVDRDAHRDAEGRRSTRSPRRHRPFLARLAPLVADPVANRDADRRAASTASLDERSTLLERAARFSLPPSGWGFAYAWRGTTCSTTCSAHGARPRRRAGTHKLADFDARIAAYDALPLATPDDERFKALRAAELVVSTTLDPRLPRPRALRAALNGKRDAFAQRATQFADVLASPGSSFAATGRSRARAAAGRRVRLAAVRPRRRSAIAAVILAEDIARTLERALRPSRRAGSAAVHDQLDAARRGRFAGARRRRRSRRPRRRCSARTSCSSPSSRSRRAGRRVGKRRRAASESLLDLPEDRRRSVDFPVDEWLYGAARVRPMLHAWETTVLLAEALRRPRAGAAADPASLPGRRLLARDAVPAELQLPTATGCSTPRTTRRRSTRRAAVRAAARRVDRGDSRPRRATPGSRSTSTGPNNEPPQSILLVTPATASGTLAVGRPGRRAQRDARPGEEARGRAAPARRDALRALPAGDVMAATLYGISIATTPGRGQRRRSQPWRRADA